MEVSVVMGLPQKRWMVYFRENPNLKWMMTRGTHLVSKSSTLLDPAVGIEWIGCKNWFDEFDVVISLLSDGRRPATVCQKKLS